MGSWHRSFFTYGATRATVASIYTAAAGVVNRPTSPPALPRRGEGGLPGARPSRAAIPPSRGAEGARFVARPTPPPAPPRRGEGSLVIPPSRGAKGARGLGSSPAPAFL